MTAPCHWCGCLPAGVGGSTGTHRRDCPGARTLRQVVDDVAARIDRCRRRLDLLDVLGPPTGRHEDEDEGAGSSSWAADPLHRAPKPDIPPNVFHQRSTDGDRPA